MNQTENNIENYNRNRPFADKFERHIKAILGGIFFTNDFNKDVSEATDLLILTIESNLRFACRIRRHKYIEKYSQEFTIRYKVKFGGKTEFDKIKEGFADYMFYGFCDEQEKYIVRYSIIDLRNFRQHLINNPEMEKNKIQQQQNNTDLTGFIFFNYNEFPTNLISFQWAGRYDEKYLIF